MTRRLLTAATSAATTAAITALIASNSVALAAGDAAKGKAVYKRCSACHEIDKEKNKVGPHLVGIVGRKAGIVGGFQYSKSLLDKAAAGLVWHKANLDKYLEKPKDLIPNGKMAFAGLSKPADRENLIAYLEEAATKK